MEQNPGVRPSPAPPQTDAPMQALRRIETRPDAVVAGTGARAAAAARQTTAARYAARARGGRGRRGSRPREGAEEPRRRDRDVPAEGESADRVALHDRLGLRASGRRSYGWDQGAVQNPLDRQTARDVGALVRSRGVRACSSQRCVGRAPCASAPRPWCSSGGGGGASVGRGWGCMEQASSRERPSESFAGCSFIAHRRDGGDEASPGASTSEFDPMCPGGWTEGQYSNGLVQNTGQPGVAGSTTCGRRVGFDRV